MSPVSALRLALLLTLSGVGVTTLGLVTAWQSALGLTELYVVHAAFTLAIVAIITTMAAGQGHPWRRPGPANVVTAIRLGLVALIVAAARAVPSPLLAVVIVGVALVITLMDGLDGWLARRTGLASEFGARLDMETDALLVLALSMLAWTFGKAGAWILAAGLMRYAYVAAGWLAPWLNAPVFPSVRRKAICVVEIIGLCVVLLPGVEPPLSAWLAALLLLALTYSFAVDVVWLWRRRDGEPILDRRRAGLALALLWLNGSLSFSNLWPTPAVLWRGQLSLEFLLLISALLMMAARWPVAPWLLRTLTVLWLVLMLGHYTEVTATALWGRDLNFYWDLRFLPDVFAMLAVAAHSWRVAVVVLALIAIVAIVYLATRWSLRRVMVAAGAPGSRALLIGICAGLGVLFVMPWLGLDRPQMLTFAKPATGLYATQARLIARGLSRSQVLPPSPSFDADLSRVQGADVLLFFIESYGAVAYERPALAAPLEPARARLAAAIHDAGFSVASAYVTSPTFGGSSWFAHVTLLSGISVSDPDTNAQLLSAHRQTLPGTFARHGYRTVAVMPGMWSPWPEGAFYGFADTLNGISLGYQGPPFGWWDLTDQYAYAKLDALEVDKPSRPPLFVFLPTVSTHTPFTPTPPYQPDWPKMLTAEPYTEAELEAAYDGDPDWTNLGLGYVRAMNYSYAAIAGYVEKHAGRDVVIVLIGDHQPPALVSGEGATWEVPVHVISSRPAILEALVARGFRAGLAPTRPTLGPMETLTPLLLQAFGGYK